MVVTVSFDDRDEDHSVSTAPPHEVSNNLSGEIIITFIGGAGNRRPFQGTLALGGPDLKVSIVKQR